MKTIESSQYESHTTLRRVYAALGIPDSVWSGKGKMEWTYHTKQGDLRFTFDQGRVTAVRI